MQRLPTFFFVLLRFKVF